MNDKKTTIEDLKSLMAEFVKEREWDQFHTPKNLSMALSVEASELSELFMWVESKDSFDMAKTKKQAVSDELADVLSYVIAICNVTGIDLADAFQSKIIKNKKKYPLEKAKGRSIKYTDL